MNKCLWINCLENNFDDLEFVKHHSKSFNDNNLNNIIWIAIP